MSGSADAGGAPARERVAAIDCGTNSIRLLVADVVDGRLVPVRRELRIVRLGEDVDRTGLLAAGALQRTGAALAEYVALLQADGAHRVRMVATSATRDARNRDEFAGLVRELLGVPPEVISGREEAQLSFTGAAAGLGPDGGPLLVTDIGGGSSELVHGDPARPGDLAAHSMPVGSVRMTERHLHDDPPTPDQVARVTADVRAALAAAARDVPLHEPARLVGVAGTVTTVAALALGLRRYDPDVLDGAVVSADRVREVTDRLLAMTHDERAAEPAIHPGRVDVITGGALILRALLDELAAPELTVSEHDILDGIALSLIRDGR